MSKRKRDDDDAFDERGVAIALGLLRDGSVFQDRFEVEDGATNDLEHIGGSGLFQQPPGSVTTPQHWNLLAGTFQTIFLINHPNGWVARLA